MCNSQSDGEHQPHSSVTVTPVLGGLRITGVTRYLGYTDNVVLPPSDAHTLAAWLRRDGDVDAAEVIEAALTSG
ncbi:hypothetical protein NJBCHELONAE_02290 [Mycobacteroides chelonae]|uniref:Uncharacterized protein n=2 Tax=Mycobacteriaceae TaxID=1762 RepID=A0ABM7HSX6_MYCME|nr:hypothetical protein MMAGJ_29450 [Mycolicibacterium mageritense]GLE54918.1 hypothetical protein NJBCHELONAE_02290 [Mycobacteroides chelonae]CDO22090.1 hypothetical protein BN978_02555 [Mycolicibacterium mageritense DSM 44476 = CIP 104973]